MHSSSVSQSDTATVRSMDLSALPPTIDFAGPNGSAFYRTTQLSYMCDKLKNWKFGVSMEMPSVDGTTNNDLSINTQRNAGLCHFRTV